MTARQQIPALPADHRTAVRDLNWRTDNMGRVLFSASYVFVQDELRVVNQNASVLLTQAQMALFRHMDAQTTGLTQIASRAMMTKQAMLELVDKAERLGLVLRRADPQDRRAKHVELTEAGADLVDRLSDAETAAESRLVSIVGADFVDELRTQLRLYLASLRPDLRVPDHLGRVLRAATDVFVGEGMRVVRQVGLGGVRDVDMALYRNLDLHGTRLTVVAERAQMTKQAMRELVGKTEALGFVERSSDPEDGRAKIIRFTSAGLDMLDHVREGILQAEAALERITGSPFLGEAKRRLRLYVDAADPTRLTAVDQV